MARSIVPRLLRSESNLTAPRAFERFGARQWPPIRPIGIVAYDRVEFIDLTGPMEVIALINEQFLRNGIADVPVYPIQVLAKRPGLVKTSRGIQIYADHAYTDVSDEIDTILIPGSKDVDTMLTDPDLRQWICAMHGRGRRLVSVCTGAFLLAEAGLLDGKRATCHWAYCDRLASDYPSVKVEPNKSFLRDGTISTSAGAQPDIDMVLSLVKEDWGSEQAALTADSMNTFLRCRGGPSQFDGVLCGHGTTSSWSSFF